MRARASTLPPAVASVVLPTDRPVVVAGEDNLRSDARVKARGENPP